MCADFHRELIFVKTDFSKLFCSLMINSGCYLNLSLYLHRLLDQRGNLAEKSVHGQEELERKNKQMGSTDEMQQ